METRTKPSNSFYTGEGALTGGPRRQVTPGLGCQHACARPGQAGIRGDHGPSQQRSLAQRVHPEGVAVAQALFRTVEIPL